jgi:hypothetical protein
LLPFLYQDKKGSGVSGATPLKKPRFKRPSTPFSLAQRIPHANPAHKFPKRNPVKKRNPLGAGPGKTAGPGSRECQKA